MIIGTYSLEEYKGAKASKVLKVTTVLKEPYPGKGELCRNGQLSADGNVEGAKGAKAIKHK